MYFDVPTVMCNINDIICCNYTITSLTHPILINVITVYSNVYVSYVFTENITCNYDGCSKYLPSYVMLTTLQIHNEITNLLMLYV